MIITKNKRAYFDYNILETCEAGIVLRGFEVKSVKLGHISLKGSYVTIKSNEAFLLNAHISAYQPKNMPQNYDPTRTRKLLLKRSETKILIGKIASRGLTVVPLSVYTKRGKIKVQIGLVKSKTKRDKRETIKKRIAQREMNMGM